MLLWCNVCDGSVVLVKVKEWSVCWGVSRHMHDVTADRKSIHMAGFFLLVLVRFCGII